MSVINLQELLVELNSYLKIHEFKDYGPNGIQIEGKNTIKKCMFSTSASLEVIQHAANTGIDALIVHHGLFWDKDSRVIEDSMKKKIKLLLENEISLIAYHLPLDAHHDIGNNAMILKTIGACHLESFEAIGMKGLINMKKNDLIHHVKKQFHVDPMIPPCDLNEIAKIACVSGGGHSYLKMCKQHGVNAFITGTHDEWVWDYAQENNLLFIALGHYRSENLGIKMLSEHVQKRFGLECLYFETQNPY
jgi:dinuclear metal center YbgI/SA1388 family protein